MWQWRLKTESNKYSFHLTVDEANFLDKITSKYKIDWFYIDASCYIHDAEDETNDDPYQLMCDLDDAMDSAEDEFIPDKLLTIDERKLYNKIFTRAVTCAKADGLLPAEVEVVSHVGMAHSRRV